jgi:hypothetical protein
MSSRSLLEDCDLDPDAIDNDTHDEISDGIGSIPKTPVRFSAGRSMANRGTPMSRITEHTRESSAYGSYSDLSGRNSFESASPRGKYNNIGRAMDGSTHKRSVGKRRGFDFSPSPKPGTPSTIRRFDILNIQDLQSLMLSEGDSD